MKNKSRSKNTATRIRKRGSRQSAGNMQWLSGYITAKVQAAALARLYQKELTRMATDDAMLDPARTGDFSPEARARSDGLDRSMWEKAFAAHRAEDIAGAIDTMQPSTGHESRLVTDAG